MIYSLSKSCFIRHNIKPLIIIVMIITIFVLQIPVTTVFAVGGNWIDDASAYQPPMEGDIFLVSTANQLAWVSYMVQNGSTFSGKIVELQNDIDLAGKEWSPIGGWDGTQTDTNKSFKGNFDGKGYKIKNMRIDLPNRDYVGLFGRAGGVIKSIGVIDVDIRGNSRTGGLVGFAVGYVSGTITNCYSKGSVTGYKSVGGLVGYGYNYTVSNCYVEGNVTGASPVGGLVGDAEDSEISNCYAEGNVKGASPVGGLVGDAEDSEISNCYATMNVTGEYYVYGLVGKCTSTTIIAYWNTNMQRQAVGSTPSTSSKLTGLTTDEMKSPAFVGMLNDHININWAAWKYDANNENDGYPILDYARGTPNPDIFWIANAQQPTIVGNTYEIRTAGQLAWIAKETNSGNDFSGKTVKLINNIDLQGKEWTPIGGYDYSYEGTFDGSNKRIQNLTSGGINYPSSFKTEYSYYGLFGDAGYAVIQKVGMENVNIYSTGRYVGGLVGSVDYSTISSCYATGNVTGESTVGGLAGSVHSSTISNCYAIGNIIGNSAVGGLVGSGDYGRKISNCYATGNVTGNSSVGGLVGSDNYSSAISLSFWNTSAIHKIDGIDMPDAGKKGAGNLATDPVGLLGKTLVELKQKSTYGDWDFVSTWAIDPNKNGGLPYLRGFDMTNTPVSGVSLNYSAIALDVGEQISLQASISPANASNSFVSFQSNNQNIASVSPNGVVTGISFGRAIITVTTQDGNKTATCEVIVNPKPVVYDYKTNSIEILNAQYINIAIPASGGFYASANITKNTSNIGTKYVLMAVYEKGGNLMLVKPATIRLNQGQSTSVDIWIDNIDNANIGTIKVFVRDSMGNMVPLSNVGMYKNK